MRRVDLTPALRTVTQADLHAGGRRILTLLDEFTTTGMWEYELSVFKDHAMLQAIRWGNKTETLEYVWPVMEAYGAILFLVNQGQSPEKRSFNPGFGKLGFLIDWSSGLLPPGIAALRCNCRLYPPPNLSASIHILRNVGLEHVNCFAKEKVN